MNKWDELFKKNNHRGYEKVRIFLNNIGFKKNFKIFNIVGTNGKGSVSQYLNDSFIASGKKVGMFTSPHIFKPNERIKINNKEISSKSFFKLAKKLDFSFFETMFIVAMLYFQQKNIDIAIIEAGIGGSKDTTKAIEGDYGTVTSIGLDHTEILGNSLKKIAKEKSGIINQSMKFFVPESIDKSLRKYFDKNSLLINNIDKNYKNENKKLAIGILKYFKIKPLLNEVPYRTKIEKNNGYIAIKDVAHNEDGIKASIKYLKEKEIKYDKVIISIQKQKMTKNIKKMFKGKKIFFHKLNNSYFTDKNEIKNLEKEYKNQNQNTLYIGTFRTINILKNENSKKIIFKNLLLGNIKSFKLSIFMITIGSLILALSQILGYFLRFKIGPMEISFDYVFYMIFGLFFGFIYGSLFALINDLLKTILIVGFGNWLWQYAILPPIGIVVISSLFKEFIWNKKDKWLLSTIILFLITDVFALTIILINNATSTYTFRNNHKEMLDLFYIFIIIIILTQITSIFIYWKTKNKRQVIRKFINSISLTIIILVIMSWIWGPFAFTSYMNRFYGKNYSIENKYLIFLIPRVIKAIPECMVWSIILFSTFEFIEVSTKRVSKNRW